MADIIDEANERAELFLERALQNKKPEGPVANGKCHFCQTPIKSGRFCDKDCAEDWEYENKIKSAQYAGGAPRDFNGEAE